MYCKYYFRKVDSRVIIVSNAQHFQRDWHFTLSAGSSFTSVNDQRLMSLVHSWLVFELRVDTFL